MKIEILFVLIHPTPQGGLYDMYENDFSFSPHTDNILSSNFQTGTFVLAVHTEMGTVTRRFAVMNQN